MNNTSTIRTSDEAANLHKKFTDFAKNRKFLLNKMLTMLPEIYESEVYKKYAKDIYEYAGRFGNVGRSTVAKRLRLEKHLIDKPELKAAMEVVGVHKIALLAPVTTPKTDAAMADIGRHISKSGIVKLTKELRDKDFTNKNPDNLGLFDSINSDDTDNSAPCRAKSESVKIELSGDLLFKFLKLKKKFNKNNKETLEMLIDSAFDDAFASEMKSSNPSESEIKNTETCDKSNHEKSSHKKLSPVTTLTKQILKKTDKPVTRYIPAAIKRAVKHKSNHHCAYPNCNRPGEALHHTERFSICRNHKNLVYLCNDHHEFAHNGLIENENDCHSEWRLNLDSAPKNSADLAFRKHRQSAFV